MRRHLGHFMLWVDHVLSAPLDGKGTYPDDRFRCQAPASLTYYNANTRPRSRQRGEGVMAVRSHVNGR